MIINNVLPMKKNSLFIDIKTLKLHTKNLYDSSDTGLSIDLCAKSCSFPKETIQHSPSEKDSTPSLLKIRSEKDQCFIVPTDLNKTNSIWKFINKPSKAYILQTNDVVRLAAGQFRVLYVLMDKIEAKTTHYSNNSISISKSWSFFNVSSQIDRAFMGETFKQQPVCRACNTDEISINNILIKPCDCRSYIHLQCYRNELKKKMKMEILNDSVVIIENASLGCEKCGGKSLIVMSFCNYKKDLMELGLFGEYVIFEKNDGKTVVVDLERHKDIFIGRSEECLLRFEDPSISEVHCRISRTKTGLILTDCHSKYGTSVQIQRPLCIDNDSTCIQIGDSLIKIRKKSKKSWFLC